MRHIPHALALVAVIATTPALAEKPAGRHVNTTADLIELCGIGVDDPSYPAARGFCLGYLDAVMDYHEALTAGPTFSPIACPHKTVTREELVVVVLDWSERNAAYLTGETPVHGVMRAVSEKWPCSGQ